MVVLAGRGLDLGGFENLWFPAAGLAGALLLAFYAWKSLMYSLDAGITPPPKAAAAPEMVTRADLDAALAAAVQGNKTAAEIYDEVPRGLPSAYLGTSTGDYPSAVLELSMALGLLARLTAKETSCCWTAAHLVP